MEPDPPQAGGQSESPPRRLLPCETGWEHFHHEADIGVRGYGRTLGEAFEHTAVAMTAVILDPGRVADRKPVQVHVSAGDWDILLTEWLNALVYEMATRRMLFRRFRVKIGDGELHGTAWGEPIDRDRHRPAVEIKGATFTELSVRRDSAGRWLAQCVVDV